MKKLILFALISLVITPTINAHETSEPHVETIAQLTTSASPSALPEPTSSDLNKDSFELFWPLTAGKTKEDSVYFLKMFKENVRGMFIFGTAEKANYRVLRATKRMLEAEVLVNKDKKELATQTVSSSNNLLKLATDSMNGVEGNETVKAEMKNRLDRLIILVDRLNTKSEGDLKAQLELNHTMIESLLKQVTS